MEVYLFIGGVVIVLLGALGALVATVRFYNSSDGERQRRIRMQGPFVPLSAEDIAEDEERSRKRRGAAHGEP